MIFRLKESANHDVSLKKNEFSGNNRKFLGSSAGMIIRWRTSKIDTQGRRNRVVMTTMPPSRRTASIC